MILTWSLVLCFLLQARDAYYSGDPLIVDDMFDKVEVSIILYYLWHVSIDLFKLICRVPAQAFVCLFEWTNLWKQLIAYTKII
jgi:hypothetical protein